MDLKHHTMEEMFKSAEWYEKKAQTQLQNSTEKLVEHAGNALREKAGEVSSVFASELSHASRSYVEQSHQQLEETVRDAFETRALAVCGGGGYHFGGVYRRDSAQCTAGTGRLPGADAEGPSNSRASGWMRRARN